MFGNLEAELARRNIYRADVAKWLGRSIASTSKRLTGKRPFYFCEAVTIKQRLNLGDMPLEELFRVTNQD